MQNNLLRRNQGGLKIQSDSNGVPTSLKAVIHNNVFADNNVSETVFLQGRRASPYQEVTLYHNYVTRSHVYFKNVMLLHQVVANLTENHIFGFHIFGYHIMESTVSVVSVCPSIKHFTTAVSTSKTIGNILFKYNY